MRRRRGLIRPGPVSRAAPGRSGPRAGRARLGAALVVVVLAAYAIWALGFGALEGTAPDLVLELALSALAAAACLVTVRTVGALPRGDAIRVTAGFLATLVGAWLLASTRLVVVLAGEGSACGRARIDDVLFDATDTAPDCAIPGPVAGALIVLLLGLPVWAVIVGLVVRRVAR